MNNMSTFVNNGSQLQLKAGVAAISAMDLISIGGPGGEAYTVGCMDYARQAQANTILPQTSLNASAMPGVGRSQVTRDAQGNIFILGTNSSGNAVVYKSTPTGTSQMSQVLDATATTCRTGKLLPLSNGNFAAVYARSAGALYFTIFDPQLNIVAGPTSVATERNNSNIVYHDALEISGAGFAIFYQTSGNTNIAMTTYSVAGSQVLAPTNIVTLASTAADCFIRAKQQSGSANITVAYRSTMTVGGTAGTGFVVVNTSGAVQAGPTNIDSTSTFGFVELSMLSGYFSIAEANGTNLKCAVFNNSGVQQGSTYSTADTLNSSTYPQVKLTNDGTQFWLAYFGSVANGLNVVQIPTSDATAGKATTGMSSATLSATTYALDAEIINGFLIALAASSSTSGQYYLAVGLPDASLGISAPYQKTGATSFGTAAGTTGSNMPRVLSGGGGLYTGSSPPTNYPANPSICGDWTAIFCYDQQNTAATYLGILKFEASAVVGVSQSALSVGSTGSSVSVNSGPGSYQCNTVSGTQGTAFNHLQSVIAGAAGTMYNMGVTLLASLPTTSSGNAIQLGIGNITPPGFMGIFGNGQYQIYMVPGTYTFTVPNNVFKIRVRVVGAGGSGASGAVATGSGGGGFAYGVFNVTPGQTYTITVGAGGVGVSATNNGNAGGSSSFGSLISATGGSPGNASASNSSNPLGGAGGVGSGGDFQSSGGRGGNKNAGTGNCGTGGGAAGSQLGNGGRGGDLNNTTGGWTGGGAVGGNSGGDIPSGGSAIGLGGASPFGSALSSAITAGPDQLGVIANTNGANGTNNPANATLRFPFDGFTGGGGAGNGGGAAGSGGIGAAGGGSSGNVGGAGGIGGGGGGGDTGSGAGGRGAGSGGTTTGTSANGGDGLCVVEY